MPLTDAQIDRYSRQIIVPRVGGRAQERILAARIVFAADSRDLEPALAYLVGAGVGRIELECGGAAGVDELAAAMRSLNPDSAVGLYDGRDSSRRAPDLVFAIIGGTDSLSRARALCANFVRASAVIARLDSPARIGVFPAPPPCARCAGDLLAPPFGARVGEAGVIAMAATAEAFKLLAGYDATPRAALVEFDGYESLTREAPANPACACASEAP